MSSRAGGGRRGRGGRGRGGKPLSAGRAMLQRSAKEAGLSGQSFKSLEDITRPALFPDFEWHSNGGLMVKTYPVSKEDTTLLDETKPPVITSTHIKKESKNAANKTAKRKLLIERGRALQERFQQLPFYLLPNKEVDVVRWSSSSNSNSNGSLTILESTSNKKQKKEESPDGAVFSNVLQYMGVNPGNMQQLQNYYPEELLTKEATTKGKASAAASATLSDVDPSVATAVASKPAEDTPTALPEDQGDNDVGETEFVDDDEENEEEDADYATNYYASDDDDNDNGDNGDGGGDEAEAVF